MGATWRAQELMLVWEVREASNLRPLKLRAFIDTRRLDFLDYIALELLFKKLLEFHVVKRSIDFCQMTSTDWRNTFIIVPA